jgi:hypothetical protein
MTMHASVTRSAIRLAVAAGALAPALALAACGASHQNLRKAQTSAYDADFALVFETVGKVVRAEYPHGQDDATQGVIKTAWHLVPGVHEDAPPNPGYQPAQPSEFGEAPSRDAQVLNRNRMATRNRHARSQETGKSFFIRFDVFVEGKRPFRVRVKGHASEQEQGLTPRPFADHEQPYWVGEREKTLMVHIYEALQEFAVPIPGADAPGNQPAS